MLHSRPTAWSCRNRRWGWCWRSAGRSGAQIVWVRLDGVRWHGENGALTERATLGRHAVEHAIYYVRPRSLPNGVS